MHTSEHEWGEACHQSRATSALGYHTLFGQHTEEMRLKERYRQFMGFQSLILLIRSPRSLSCFTQQRGKTLVLPEQLYQKDWTIERGHTNTHAKAEREMHSATQCHTQTTAKSKAALHGISVIHGRVMLLNFNLCEQLNFN